MRKSEELKKVVSTTLGDVGISFESGWIAKQAGGSVIVRSGDTMVLVTVCSAGARPDIDFFPMVVEYQERTYAAGKIPGGYLKREGRPGEGEILTCRIIDRPIRPLFPDGYHDEVQIICTVLSADGVNSPDVLALCGASAALHISSLPFLGPLAAVRVGRVDGTLIANPTTAQLAKSDLDYVIAGTKEAIVMVEGGSEFVPEEELLEALFFGHQELQKIIAIQDELRTLVGQEKQVFVAPEGNKALINRVAEVATASFLKALTITDKAARREALSQAKSEAVAVLTAEFPEETGDISAELSSLNKKLSRKLIIDEEKRIDGRPLNKVRPIECQTGILPRAHGSALFTRGETQAIVTTTLGTSVDSQRIDSLTNSGEKTFLLHYNFPPYSTGEVKMMRGTGRREIGHGALAERALRPIIPKGKEFPYVVRIVSDIMESNGSSSMASVCGGTLSLLDAGINIKKPVAGVAMGLIKEGDKVKVLTDILGDEDHFGDMDFKVCGSSDGVTALQMDIKCSGLSRETMAAALMQAREARLHILGEMAKELSAPKSAMSQYAPVIQQLKINPDKIRDVIGPGGKVIKSIVESTGVKIDIQDDGTINIASSDQEASARAIEIIKGLTEEPEIGRVYSGVVKRITDFGAFVEILPGVEGLVHISQLEESRVAQVSDVIKEGEEVPVMVLDIDRQGRIRLSRKEAMRQALEGAH
ncbi:MAG: polyribonucleotide nucleotidyltransferase [bacterium]|nr:polyribonucleotide nucleotidyltransferase [bacterium]